MYHSKQNGGNSFAFYSPEMNAAAVERLMLKSKLRRSLERDEFLVHYQPKVDLRDGRIVGAEALLRWRLPGHGDIPPSQFIPLAEETNLILEVGEWVLNRVCEDYRELQQTVTTPGRISLNLSLKQLRQASFILRFRSVFRKHGVSPTCFELEITETTLMADSKRTLHLLDELYAMGLHLSIDDFGTGYSSLSALQQFPIGTLKIDQSFVRDVDDDESDATIVRTIIEMGRSLKMNVIAEGVESLGHLHFLRRHQCGFGQGKLFGEPVTLEELRLLLARQQETGPAFAGLIAQSAEPRQDRQAARRLIDPFDWLALIGRPTTIRRICVSRNAPLRHYLHADTRKIIQGAAPHDPDFAHSPLSPACSLPLPSRRTNPPSRVIAYTKYSHPPSLLSGC